MSLAPNTSAKAILLLLVALVAFSSPAHAQPDAPAQDEVRLRIVQYGIGNAAREGDWAGIQVNVLDSALEQRDLILRVTVTDADGDRANYDRLFTANPGIEQPVWVYARMPSNLSRTADVPRVTVHEAVETGASDDTVAFRSGRPLGRAIMPSTAVDATLPSEVALFGVIGPNSNALAQYQVSPSSNNPWTPFGHEITRVVTGLDIPRLPNRWQGLMPADVLLWSSATTRATEPSALTPERARAIRQWVEFGGHLVIIIPTAGDPWFGAQHPLRAILPDIERPRRIESVDLDTLRTLITESATVPLPEDAVIHTFEPRANALPTNAQRVLNTPGGACIAVRRIVGSGAVTLVGLDLNDGALRRFDLPDAESVWHRVLGKRGDTRRSTEITDQENSDAGNRRSLDFDADISGAIARTGRAVQGILFGLVIFILYWLIAGPIGYMILKRREQSHHAWVAFIATTAVFTTVAWLGATLLRPKRATQTHLTIVESVHGQPTARARTWFSVLLPNYGRSTVAVGNDKTDAALIAPWEPGGNLVGWSKGFPDNSAYQIDSANPDAIRVPTRATIKQFRADWQGETSWGMPRPTGIPGSLEEPAITIEGLALNGTLEHALPGPLTDVRVITVRSQKRLSRPGQALGGEQPSIVTVLSPRFDDFEWDPGEPMDLGIVTRDASASTRELSYFSSIVRTGTDAQSFDGGIDRLAQRLLGARFLSQMAPPSYSATSPNSNSHPVGNRLARRRSTHLWDLGRWTTTPCVIITGLLQNEAAADAPGDAPVPITVDGRAIPSSGATLVTWIYPLPDDPPRAWDDLGSQSSPVPTDPSDD